MFIQSLFDVVMVVTRLALLDCAVSHKFIFSTKRDGHESLYSSAFGGYLSSLLFVVER